MSTAPSTSPTSSANTGPGWFARFGEDAKYEAQLRRGSGQRDRLGVLSRELESVINLRDTAPANPGLTAEQSASRTRIQQLRQELGVIIGTVDVTGTGGASEMQEYGRTDIQNLVEAMEPLEELAQWIESQGNDFLANWNGADNVPSAAEILTRFRALINRLVK